MASVAVAVLYCAALTSAAVAPAAAAQLSALPADADLSEVFCKQFPTLHLCRLHENLQGSLVELQYLLQDTEQNGELSA